MSTFAPLFPNKANPKDFQYTAEVKDAPEIAGEGKVQSELP
jgi:hypothetical protein